MAVQSMPVPRQRPLYAALGRVPWWLLVALLLGLMLLWAIVTDEDYTVIFKAVSQGIWTTVWVTLVSFTGAVILGLLIGLMRISKNRLLYEVSTFYVEIIRGVPMLVLLYYIAFVGAPQFVSGINWMGVQLSSAGITAVGQPLQEFSVRTLGFTPRSILALIIAYSAFISEIFRAGIQSIERGQVEAALSLGMSRWQAMRHIVLPQAVRRVLPPLGNDFIAMLKDSSLVSVLGVQDITQMGKVYAASTFMFFETYNVVAFMYLVMTIALTLFVRWVERKMPQTT
ncbi:MAG: amino acid ABC transporter permease [Caldilineaceae bacterium]